MDSQIADPDRWVSWWLIPTINDPMTESTWLEPGQPDRGSSTFRATVESGADFRLEYDQSLPDRNMRGSSAARIGADCDNKGCQSGLTASSPKLSDGNARPSRSLRSACRLLKAAVSSDHADGRASARYNITSADPKRPTSVLEVSFATADSRCSVRIADALQASSVA